MRRSSSATCSSAIALTSALARDRSCHERQQLANIVDQKAEPARLPNEAQRVNLLRPVHAIPRCRPPDRR